GLLVGGQVEEDPVPLPGTARPMAGPPWRDARRPERSLQGRRRTPRRCEREETRQIVPLEHSQDHGGSGGLEVTKDPLRNRGASYPSSQPESPEATRLPLRLAGDPDHFVPIDRA